MRKLLLIIIFILLVSKFVSASVTVYNDLPVGITIYDGVSYSNVVVGGSLQLTSNEFYVLYKLETGKYYVLAHITNADGDVYLSKYIDVEQADYDYSYSTNYNAYFNVNDQIKISVHSSKQEKWTETINIYYNNNLLYTDLEQGEVKNDCSALTTSYIKYIGHIMLYNKYYAREYEYYVFVVAGFQLMYTVPPADRSIYTFSQDITLYIKSVIVIKTIDERLVDYKIFYLNTQVEMEHVATSYVRSIPESLYLSNTLYTHIHVKKDQPLFVVDDTTIIYDTARENVALYNDVQYDTFDEQYFSLQTYTAHKPYDVIDECLYDCTPKLYKDVYYKVSQQQTQLNTISSFEVELYKYTTNFEITSDYFYTNYPTIYGQIYRIKHDACSLSFIVNDEIIKNNYCVPLSIKKKMINVQFLEGGSIKVARETIDAVEVRDEYERTLIVLRPYTDFMGRIDVEIPYTLLKFIVYYKDGTSKTFYRYIKTDDRLKITINDDRYIPVLRVKVPDFDWEISENLIYTKVSYVVTNKTIDDIVDDIHYYFMEYFISTGVTNKYEVNENVSLILTQVFFRSESLLDENASTDASNYFFELPAGQYNAILITSAPLSSFEKNVSTGHFDFKKENEELYMLFFVDRNVLTDAVSRNRTELYIRYNSKNFVSSIVRINLNNTIYDYLVDYNVYTITDRYGAKSLYVMNTHLLKINLMFVKDTALALKVVEVKTNATTYLKYYATKTAAIKENEIFLKIKKGDQLDYIFLEKPINGVYIFLTNQNALNTDSNIDTVFYYIMKFHYVVYLVVVLISYILTRTVLISIPFAAVFYFTTGNVLYLLIFIISSIFYVEGGRGDE